jgi:hypothetical protein
MIIHKFLKQELFNTINEKVHNWAIREFVKKYPILPIQFIFTINAYYPTNKGFILAHYSLC